MTKAEKVDYCINELEKLYPHVEAPLDHSDAYTLLIAVLLSAQCTDARVNQITPSLFEAANNPFDMRELEVELIGTELSDFNGLVQVNNAPLSNASKLGTGSITPNEITISDLLAQADALESTLVKIVDVTISSSESTYSGTSTVTDATGSIPMFTRSQATFASTALPGGTVTMTAIVSDFNGAQVNIRSLDDIE